VVVLLEAVAIADSATMLQNAPTVCALPYVSELKDQIREGSAMVFMCVSARNIKKK
jgi:hypothetical protein